MIKKFLYFYASRFICGVLLMAFAVSHAPAHEIPAGGDNNTPPDLFGLKTDKPAFFAPSEVGVTEKLGQYIPPDIAFKDENGTEVRLGNFINRPTLILPVFFHCAQECSILLANLATALNDVSFTPESEYKTCAISFDASEAPSDAALAKKDYLKLLKPDFPLESWKFLTGPAQSIGAMTEAMGFHFKELKKHDFVHPNVLVAVAADGKIIRYLYGPYFLPFDISMAIAEAQKGTPEISIKKLVSYCYSYDPVGKKYVFKTFRITGTAVIGFLVVFLFFLLRKKQPSDQHPKGE